MDDSYDKHPQVDEADSTRGRRLMGAPGQRVWIFATPEANSNHIRGLACDVEFVYRRPWEKDVEPISTKQLTVVVG